MFVISNINLVGFWSKAFVRTIYIYLLLIDFFTYLFIPQFLIVNAELVTLSRNTYLKKLSRGEVL